jgi:DNA-binding transcriptional MerR regulator
MHVMSTDVTRAYSIDALLAEGFSRVQLFNLRKTGVLPKAHGRGSNAYYTDTHLKIVRAIKSARDEHTKLTDIAERFGREFKGWP